MDTHDDTMQVIDAWMWRYDAEVPLDEFLGIHSDCDEEKAVAKSLWDDAGEFHKEYKPKIVTSTCMEDNHSGEDTGRYAVLFFLEHMLTVGEDKGEFPFIEGHYYDIWLDGPMIQLVLYTATPIPRMEDEEITLPDPPKEGEEK